jgi:hypothetical protein
VKHKNTYSEKIYVRDLHVYKKPDENVMIVLVLYVNNQARWPSFQVTRTYYTSQFFYKDDCITELFEKPNKLYVIPESDELTRKEHRREFKWWEKFQILGSSCVAYQIETGPSEYFIAILDLEKCLKDKQKNKFYKHHIGRKTKTYLNWIFLNSSHTKFSLDLDFSKKE